MVWVWCQFVESQPAGSGFWAAIGDLKDATVRPTTTTHNHRQPITPCPGGQVLELSSFVVGGWGQEIVAGTEGTVITKDMDAPVEWRSREPDSSNLTEKFN